jgi:5'-deoxynucleotidase YfbR-like HD superfamily hydrolase
MSTRPKNKDRPILRPLPSIKKDVWAHTHPSERGIGFTPTDHSEKDCYCTESHQMILDPEEFGGTDFPPLVTPEVETAIKELYATHPELHSKPPAETKATIDLTPLYLYTGVEEARDYFHEGEAWIQTYSGRRFNPVNPIPEAIVIQDVAHALSMQCRFSGHVKRFYSVAQHCVLVSYLCDKQDALWGLLHDATEAYLVDVPRPLKHSGQLEGYIKIESLMQSAVCQRFGLEDKEPDSVKYADTLLLSTEARDLLPNLRSDWTQPTEPLPLTIKPLGPGEAKHLYLKRFFQLMGSPECFDRYLQWETEGRI